MRPQSAALREPPVRWIPSAERWAFSAAIAAVFLALPILSVIWIALSASDSIWPHLFATVLPRALVNTMLLLAGAGALTLVIGTLTAWIVTMFRFPGRELADKLLVLPMAMPVYIVAYAYVELLDFAGPVQTALRSWFGAQSTVAHLIPDIRSLPGAILLFSIVLYPYVYLTARASFIQQSVCALEVARTLGRSAAATFWAVALPMARPALVAGVSLVLMECLNDLGAVQYLGVETLSASIYATWTQRSNLPGAAQLALVLLVLVMALLAGERRLRGDASFHAATGRYRAIPFETLEGWRATAAFATVIVPVLLGFAIPFLLLAKHAVAHFGAFDVAAFFKSACNSLVLAALASAVAIALALWFAYAARLHKSAVTRIANHISALGYALPGTVLAIGLLSPLAAFDNGVDAFVRAHFGFSTGLLLSG
jgi:iron(III) transport system permease protein